MANGLIFSMFLGLILSRAESCFIPDSLYVIVPQAIPAGYEITKVEVADCDTKSLRLTLRDQSFTIHADGTVVAASPVSVEGRGRTFSVRARDSSGPGSEMEVHLVSRTKPEVKYAGTELLRRTKRRWGPPPFKILENENGPFPRDIERIVSDSEAKHSVYYTFSGPGFNQHPVGVFSLDKYTGMLRVHKPVDREEFPQFQLVVSVFDRTTHEPTDLPLMVTVEVDDVNDNAPTFTDSLEFGVLEKSNAGTKVGQVGATDRDKIKTLHVKIKYSLLTGLDLFDIDPATGVITTVTNTLDREVKDKHMVTVQIKDMNGAVNGLSNTATATITIGDINDNPPTFTKTSYAVTVKENEKEKLLLRIPIEDKDLMYSPNWVSEFVITKGNENGNFRMETDPKTNEGLLYVSKPLDYEEAKSVHLEIMAQNVVELMGTEAKWLSIPVELTVTNEDEGPKFTAPTIEFTVKENVPNGTLIGSYTAVDPETKSSAGIKYYKATDPASWINVDKNTGELRVANIIDRESPFVQNGIYNIIMKAVDASSKTGTGTVIIRVEDVNDNMPTVPSKLVMCEKDGELGSVLVTAEDNDQIPFSSPFIFSLLPTHADEWVLHGFNGTAVMLQQKKVLHLGIHKVSMDIKDLQGNGDIQEVEVRICNCRNGACLAKESSVSLGPLALLAMLLPLVLLLLLCLLLLFFCVTMRKTSEIEDAGDSGGILITDPTEAPGEEVDSSLITVPAFGFEPAVKGTVKDSMLMTGWLGNKSSSTIGAHSTHENGMHKSGCVTSDVHEYSSGQHDSQYGTQQFNGGHFGGSMFFDNRYLIQDSALLHTWQTNGLYLHQKLAYLGTEEDGRYADDIIHSYRFEGAGSAAGSVGCCSDCSDDDLDFLNTLGPKFKTLADVCTKR